MSLAVIRNNMAMDADYVVRLWLRLMFNHRKQSDGRVGSSCIPSFLEGVRCNDGIYFHFTPSKPERFLSPHPAGSELCIQGFEDLFGPGF